MKNIEDKICLIQSASSQEEAFKRFNDIMQEYGYNNNVYTLMNDHPSIGQKAFHGLATTYPKDWLDFYNARQYQNVDAVWERLLKSPTPFFWTELVNRLKGANNISEDYLKNSIKVMNEAQDAGVADGIGISYISPMGEIAGMGLSRAAPEKTQSYNEMAEIFLIATFFHEKFLSFYNKPDAPKLTAREREILLWASENKSDSEIGDILNVSTPTVRFHWKNIFDKLGAYGRWLAIIKAIRMQLITPHLIRPPYQG